MSTNETVVVAGPDEHDIGNAIEDAGFAVSRVDVANRAGLEKAGITQASTYVLTEIEQATSIAVAKELNEDVKVVVYTDGSLPDFARGQADLMLDPDLFEPDAVAAELG